MEMILTSRPSLSCEGTNAVHYESWVEVIPNLDGVEKRMSVLGCR